MLGLEVSWVCSAFTSGTGDLEQSVCSGPSPIASSFFWGGGFVFFVHLLVDCLSWFKEPEGQLLKSLRKSGKICNGTDERTIIRSVKCMPNIMWRRVQQFVNRDLH